MNNKLNATEEKNNLNKINIFLVANLISGNYSNFPEAINECNNFEDLIKNKNIGNNFHSNDVKKIKLGLEQFSSKIKKEFTIEKNFEEFLFIFFKYFINLRNFYIHYFDDPKEKKQRELKEELKDIEEKEFTFKVNKGKNKVNYEETRKINFKNIIINYFSNGFITSEVEDQYFHFLCLRFLMNTRYFQRRIKNIVENIQIKEQEKEKLLSIIEKNFHTININQIIFSENAISEHENKIIDTLVYHLLLFEEDKNNNLPEKPLIKGILFLLKKQKGNFVFPFSYKNIGKDFKIYHKYKKEKNCENPIHEFLLNERERYFVFYGDKKNISEENFFENIKKVNKKFFLSKKSLVNLFLKWFFQNLDKNNQKIQNIVIEKDKESFKNVSPSQNTSKEKDLLQEVKNLKNKFNDISSNQKTILVSKILKFFSKMVLPTHKYSKYPKNDKFKKIERYFLNMSLRNVLTYALRENKNLSNDQKLEDWFQVLEIKKDTNDFLGDCIEYLEENIKEQAYKKAEKIPNEKWLVIREKENDDKTIEEKETFFKFVFKERTIQDISRIFESQNKISPKLKEGLFKYKKSRTGEERTYINKRVLAYIWIIKALQESKETVAKNLFEKLEKNNHFSILIVNIQKMAILIKKVILIFMTHII